MLANRPLKKIADQELQEEQRKTAEAQQKAAEAQLAVVQTLKQLSEPRHIVMEDKNGDREVRQAKFKELAKYGGSHALVTAVRDKEAEDLAFDITQALRKAGWNANLVDIAKSNVPQGLIQEGVQIRTLEKIKGVGAIPSPPAVAAVLDLLKLDLGWPSGAINGVRWEPDVIWEGKPQNSTGISQYGFRFPDEQMLVITVGLKPTSSFFTTQGIAHPELLPKPN